MYEFLGGMFNYFSRNLIMSVLFFVITIFMFEYLYKNTLQRLIRSKILFLNNKDKEVYFAMILFGAIYLILAGIVIPHFKYPFIWLLGSCALFVGGLLGLIPFSFKNRENRPNKP